jgi:hypothetical protein
MIGRGAVLACALLVVFAGRTEVAAATDALDEARTAFSKVDDYRMTIVVHEIAGGQVEDRTYSVWFKKPSLERIDIVAGPGKGSGIVWLGGDKVKAHRGGFLAGIHVVFDLHDAKVSTLRGDAVDTAAIPSMLAEFASLKGTISTAPGPQIDGENSIAETLDVADPAADKGISRIVLYLSSTTHLPVRRERFVGTQLVKSEDVMQTQTNVGLGASDFPW